MYFTITFVNINIVQFYQSPKAASICKDKQPAISNLHLFITLGPNEKKKRTLPNLNQIENFDITGLLLKELFNPFHILASNFSGIKIDAGGTVFFLYCLNK